MFKISVRRVHEPREKLNVGDKQETIDLIEGDVERRSYDSNNRFFYVGVDISIYALLAGGRSSYPPVLVKLLYSRGYSGSLTECLYSCVTRGTAMCCVGR